MRVLLVEDHQMLRAGLRILCERRAHWKVVGEASDCATALELIEREQPDLLLLDLMLADGSSIDCLPRLRQLFHGAIVVLTATEDFDVHRLARENGADAIVLKASEPAEMFAAIKCATASRGLCSSIEPTALAE